MIKPRIKLKCSVKPLGTNTKTIIDKLGGPKKVGEMAGGVSSQAVSQWRLIPVKRCRAIEAATNGAVTVHDLRPDIFGPAPGVAPAPPQDRAA